ncbi:MAG TPA: T9SS type A sorting domain-containing protein, partial [Chitinophagales bacterium]|nr:T9SS type A sorting domain-containing protein [Chitinophagales bacterium]
GVIRRTNAAAPWWGTNTTGGPDGLQGFHSNATQSISGNVATAKRSGLQMMSDFGIGFGNVALPVSLAWFEATRQNDGVLLQWRTESETDNDYFAVERSNGDGAFKPIGLVDGHGNASSAHEYRFIDETPLFGNNYYRLRQVDTDGTEKLSPVRVVRFESDDVMIRVSPNPASAQIRIDGLVEGSEVSVYAATSQLVFRFVAKASSVYVDVDKWPAGLYLIKAEDERTLRALKFEKE